MAELKVGIRADVRDARRVTRALKDIKREAGIAGTSLAAVGKAAVGSSKGLSLAVTSSGALARSQNLASVANVAVANSLRAVSAGAAQTAAAEAGATRQTTILTGAMARLRATTAGMFAGPTAGLKRFATQARTAAGSVVGASTAAAGLGAVIAVSIGVGIKSAVEFEKTMSRIEGLVGIAGDAVKDFEKPLLDIAKATAKGPNELAEALFFITSAGFEGAEAMGVLEASARAAAAGLGETKQVADAVTSAVNAYGIENLSAAQATDILVATVREGKAEADSIAGALGQILPVASELGIEFEELGGTIAALTRIGLGADQASTALGATMSALQKITPDAEKALNEFGMTGSGLRKVIREEGLLTGLKQMNDAFGDNETALIRVIPNIRALRAVLPLVGKNAGDVSKIFEEVADSAGAADKAFEVYTKTTSFELSQALVVLQTTLMKIGNDLLPAVTKAFVALGVAVETTVDFFDFLGVAVARALNGSDDPLERLQSDLAQVKRLQDEVNGTRMVTVPMTDASTGLTVLKQVERTNTRIERSIGAQVTEWKGIEILGKKIEGSYTQQQFILSGLENDIRKRIDAEKKSRLAVKGTVSAAEDLEEIVVNVQKRGPVIVIDEKLLEKGRDALTDLKAEVKFLSTDLDTLQKLGAKGVGLTEDTFEANALFAALQGQVKITKEEVLALVQSKRKLSEEIDKITEGFLKQETATAFLDNLVIKTQNMAQQFAIVQAGGSLFDIQSLQQAEQIFTDLAGAGGKTVSQIHDMILVQQAYNSALKGLDVSPFADLVQQRDALLRQQQAGVLDPAQFQVAQVAIDTLNKSIVDSALAAEGLDPLQTMLDKAESKEQQFADASKRLRAAFDAAGIVDPNGEKFEAALDALQNKIYGLTDIFAEFGKQAAQGLQSSFSDYLFDPFEDGLSGMAHSFGQMLRRLAADILANQILTSFFKTFAGGSGPVASIANTALQGLQGNYAEGGNFTANKPMLVGENGPEIITPRKSGSVIPNDMMGGQQAAPNVEVGGPTIVNTIDDGQIVAAFNRGGGGQVILNEMTEKRAAFRQALGI